MGTTRHALSRLGFAAGFVLGLAVMPALAAAAPESTPADEEPIDDESFAKSFLGKIYEREFEIPGWQDHGGGLVVPPVYIRHYRRGDGTYLVLTSRELTQAASGTPASYVVADALIVSKPRKGAQFSIACVKGDDETLRFMGEALGRPDREWWTDVRRGWEVALDTAEITETKTKGMRCTNASWSE
jgi:hypothetical protein